MCLDPDSVPNTVPNGIADPITDGESDTIAHGIANASVRSWYVYRHEFARQLLRQLR